VPVTVALLKGRANYVCHYHSSARHARTGCRRAMTRHLPKIIAFARRPRRPRRPCRRARHASIWPLVTSTRDNRLGQNCPHHAACFVLKARKEALDADVVVVNHHLFSRRHAAEAYRAPAQLQYRSARGASAARHCDTFSAAIVATTCRAGAHVEIVAPGGAMCRTFLTLRASRPAIRKLRLAPATCR
jgi:hypothetical protein